MEQKKIGVILIIIGIVIGGFVYLAKLREDNYINEIIKETNSCYLTDGTCLHEDRDWTLHVIGWVMSFGLILFGIYIGFIDKTQKVLYEHQKKVSKALYDAKTKDEFKAYISAFNDDEKRILKAVHEQDGIKQATLRFRTGMSKTALSLLLKNLEERKVISRKAAGKTNEVFLVKRF